MSARIQLLLAGKCPLKNQGIHFNLTTTDDSIAIETTTELDQLPELCSFHPPDLLLIILDGWEAALTPIFYRLPPINILSLSAQDGQPCHTLIRQNIIHTFY